MRHDVRWGPQEQPPCRNQPLLGALLHDDGVCLYGGDHARDRHLILAHKPNQHSVASSEELEASNGKLAVVAAYIGVVEVDDTGTCSHGGIVVQLPLPGAAPQMSVGSKPSAQVGAQ